MLWDTTYRMVFWAFGKRDATALTLRVNEYLSSFGSNSMPLYLPSKEKVILDEIALEKTFSRLRAKESGLFSTWLTSTNGIILDLTLDIPKYPNIQKPEVLAIGFEPEHLVGSEPVFTFEQLQNVFFFCLRLFEPFYAWGCMSGEINYSKRYEEKGREIDVMKIPLTIRWFNYFEPIMVERLGGAEKLLSAPVYLAQSVEELGGVILILQKEPFDFRNPIHLQRREKVEAYLDLNRLHKLYPR